MANLSKDLQIAPTLLNDILRLRRRLPILHTRAELGWSHYRQLLKLPTQEQVRFYEQQASANRWSVRQLQAAIKANAYAQETGKPFAVPLDEDPFAGKPLRARFGALHTYRTVTSGDPTAEDLFLDLGFSLTTGVPHESLAPEDQGRLRADMVVTAEQGPEGLTLRSRPATTRRYTYVAWVQRVIDGDTLIVIVDLGLGHQTRPVRLRLRGIDCPELSTLAGRSARDFVREALAPVNFILITTHRTDAYGRYLADVKYLAGEADPVKVLAKGTYLNRQLLQEHLAARYVR